MNKIRVKFEFLFSIFIIVIIHYTDIIYLCFFFCCRDHHTSLKMDVQTEVSRYFSKDFYILIN